MLMPFQFVFKFCYFKLSLFLKEKHIFVLMFFQQCKSIDSKHFQLLGSVVIRALSHKDNYSDAESDTVV